MLSRYTFEYRPGTIVYGENCVEELQNTIAGMGVERALVICGQTVGSRPEIIDPVIDGIGTSFVGKFDKTSPDKEISTVIKGVSRMRDMNADVLVSLGGGSSHDVTKFIDVVHALDPLDHNLEEDFKGIDLPPTTGQELVPIICIPTTLAGADLSTAAEITKRSNHSVIRSIISKEELMPKKLFYDPELFSTTPQSILCASAMNGFDKAIETPYSKNTTPITDATAVHALRLLCRGLPRVGDDELDSESLHDTIMGIVLAQYGILWKENRTTGVIHAFGHAISREFAIQQGGAHAIIAPHLLRFLFQQTDGRRELLAEGLGVPNRNPDKMAEGIVDRVVDIRNSLNLPTQLRGIGDLAYDNLPIIASNVVDDVTLSHMHSNFSPTTDDIIGVLEAAW